MNRNELMNDIMDDIIERVSRNLAMGTTNPDPVAMSRDLSTIAVNMSQAMLNMRMLRETDGNDTDDDIMDSV